MFKQQNLVSDDISKREWLILKIVSLSLLALPVEMTVMPIVHNLGIGKVWDLYLGTLGLPLWALVAVILIYRHNPRGIVWMRNIAAILAPIFLVVFMAPLFVPVSILSSGMESPPTPTQTIGTGRVINVGFCIIYAAIAYYSAKTLRKARAKVHA